jgi:aromatic ring-opening dioxygenase LigB subunit
MAWEDRNRKEKAEARRAAREYARTDDNHTYVVITGKGTRLIVKGINSARAVASKDGTYRRT